MFLLLHLVLYVLYLCIFWILCAILCWGKSLFIVVFHVQSRGKHSFYCLIKYALPFLFHTWWYRGSRDSPLLEMYDDTVGVAIHQILEYMMIPWESWFIKFWHIWWYRGSRDSSRWYRGSRDSSMIPWESRFINFGQTWWYRRSRDSLYFHVLPRGKCG